MTREEKTITAGGGHAHEIELQADILNQIGRNPRWLGWRNATGAARSIATGNIIHHGLKGSPDIIGCLARVITPGDVGKTIGQAVAIEVKLPGKKQRPEQIKFQNAWTKRAGGVYILAHSIDEAAAGLERTL